MAEALVALGLSLIAYAGGLVAFLALQRRMAAGVPPEWRSVPAVRERLEKAAGPIEIGGLLRTTFVKGWRWLVLVFAAAVFFSAIGASVWFLVLWAFVAAVFMTGGEIDSTRGEVRALREANPGLPRVRRNGLARRGRWVARALMWAGFLAAPCALAAAVVPD